MGGRHRLCIQSQNVLADLWVLSCCCFLFFSLSPSIFLGLCLWNMYPWIHNLAPQSWGNSCLPQLEQKKKKKKLFVPDIQNQMWTSRRWCSVSGRGGNSHIYIPIIRASHTASGLFLSGKKRLSCLNILWMRTGSTLLSVFCLDFWSYNTWGHPNKVFGLKIEECFF